VISIPELSAGVCCDLLRICCWNRTCQNLIYLSVC